MSEKDAQTRRPAEVVAAAIREIREERGLDQQGLADRLDELGLPMDRTTVNRVESGKRKVTLDELFTFAAALDVPPPLLLLPVTGEGVEVQVTPTLHVGPWAAWEWMQGNQPLPGQNLRRWRSGVQHLWAYDDVRRTRKAADDATVALRHAEAVGDDDGKREALRAYVPALQALLDALAGLEELGGAVDGLLAEQFVKDARKFKLTARPVSERHRPYTSAAFEAFVERMGGEVRRGDEEEG